MIAFLLVLLLSAGLFFVEKGLGAFVLATYASIVLGELLAVIVQWGVVALTVGAFLSVGLRRYPNATHAIRQRLFAALDKAQDRFPTLRPFRAWLAALLLDPGGAGASAPPSASLLARLMSYLPGSHAVVQSVSSATTHAASATGYAAVVDTLYTRLYGGGRAESTSSSSSKKGAARTQTL